MSDNDSNTIYNRTPSADTSSTDPAWSTFLASSRRYNLDITAKVCLSRGELVDLLVQSNVARYLEFRAIGSTLMHVGTAVREVPASRQTLMLSKTIPVKDKRQLMKFLQLAATYTQETPEYLGVFGLL